MWEQTVLPDFSSGLDASTQSASDTIRQQLSTSEWLGPLAPIALSPFFGLALLSGVATYGPDWLQERSALFRTEGPLDSPWLFWTMACLAILTSLPRMTKVSKPISLAAEKLEAYSAVIIFLAVRWLGSPSIHDAGHPVISDLDQATHPIYLSAGFGTLSLQLGMSVFAAINILVINFVKLFFEFMVWLIPFPTVDALLEFGNKSSCAALMAIYCYSPILATSINLMMFAFCGLIFLWVYRRTRYYRDLVVGPAMAYLFPFWFAQRGQSFRAYIESSKSPFPKYHPITVSCLDEAQTTFRISGWKGIQRWDHQVTSRSSKNRSSTWVSQRIEVVDSSGGIYVLRFRRWVRADSLYSQRPTQSQNGSFTEPEMEAP